MPEGLKAFVQYGLARTLLAFFGALPRSLADRAGRLAARLGYILARRQRETGLHNLRMAMPELGGEERETLIRGGFENLGRLLVEFSHFPALTPGNISDHVVYEGFEHFVEARTRGRGTIFLTLHMGAWELSPVAHALYGHPLTFLTRPIDNPGVDRLITHYRTLAGNTILARSNAVREILRALRRNEAVGFLIDQNTIRSEGVFADFFGIPAATTPGVATLAARTGAAVLPAYIRWERERRIHVLHFAPLVDLVSTGDRDADAAANTQKFNQILEGFVRQAPDQWLWIHKRWKTRPPGEPPLY
jgi:KDO2-lipid IV(A) lauroyltransferase